MGPRPEIYWSKWCEAVLIFIPILLTHDWTVKSKLSFSVGWYIMLILSNTNGFWIYFTSSDNGSINLRPIEMAPRSVRSSEGNSSLATSEAEYMDALLSFTI